MNVRLNPAFSNRRDPLVHVVDECSPNGCSCLTICQVFFALDRTSNPYVHKWWGTSVDKPATCLPCLGKDAR